MTDRRLLVIGDCTLTDLRLLSSPRGQKALSRQEDRLLRYLAAHPNTLLTRERVFNYMWTAGTSTMSLAVAVSRLRARLRAVDTSLTIETGWGAGILFRCPEGSPTTTLSFTEQQHAALLRAIGIADRHEPGIAERTGLEIA